MRASIFTICSDSSETIYFHVKKVPGTHCAMHRHSCINVYTHIRSHHDLVRRGTCVPRAGHVVEREVQTARECRRAFAMLVVVFAVFRLCISRSCHCCLPAVHLAIVISSRSYNMRTNIRFACQHSDMRANIPFRTLIVFVTHRIKNAKRIANRLWSVYNRL